MQKKQIKITIIVLLSALAIWACYNENSRLTIKYFFRQLVKSVF